MAGRGIEQFPSGQGQVHTTPDPPHTRPLSPQQFGGGSGVGEIAETYMPGNFPPGCSQGGSRQKETERPVSMLFLLLGMFGPSLPPAELYLTYFLSKLKGPGCHPRADCTPFLNAMAPLKYQEASQGSRMSPGTEWTLAPGSGITEHTGGTHCKQT